jgi:hypothetical protein
MEQVHEESGSDPVDLWVGIPESFPSIDSAKVFCKQRFTLEDNKDIRFDMGATRNALQFDKHCSQGGCDFRVKVRKLPKTRFSTEPASFFICRTSTIEHGGDGCICTCTRKSSDSDVAASKWVQTNLAHASLIPCKTDRLMPLTEQVAHINAEEGLTGVNTNCLNRAKRKMEVKGDTLINEGFGKLEAFMKQLVLENTGLEYQSDYEPDGRFKRMAFAPPYAAHCTTEGC